MADTDDGANNQPPGYVPAKIWEWDPANGGQFANINRPVSGATATSVGSRPPVPGWAR